MLSEVHISYWTKLKETAKIDAYTYTMFKRFAYVSAFIILSNSTPRVRESIIRTWFATI